MKFVSSACVFLLCTFSGVSQLSKAEQPEDDSVTQSQTLFDRTMKNQMMNIWAFDALGHTARRVHKALLELPYTTTIANSPHHSLFTKSGTQCHDRLFAVWNNALSNLSGYRNLAIPDLDPASVAIGNRTFDTFIAGSTLTDNLEYIAYSLRKKGLLARTFLLPADHFSQLSDIANGGAFQDSNENKIRFQKALKAIHSYTKQDIGLFLHESPQTVDPNLIAIQRSPFSSQDIEEARQSLKASEKVISWRVSQELLAISWRVQLLHHALAGAVTGGALQAIFTMGEKSLKESLPPWCWKAGDISDISQSFIQGALYGSAATTATWITSYYTGMPVWLAGALIAGTIQITHETFRAFLPDTPDIPLKTILWSLPATTVMSLGAALGDQISPIPLAGSLGGIMAARMAMHYFFLFRLE